jgi:hypothetical protein
VEENNKGEWEWHRGLTKKRRKDSEGGEEAAARRRPWQRWFSAPSLTQELVEKNEQKGRRVAAA